MERYEVGCPCIGVAGYTGMKKAAFRWARKLASQLGHADACSVTVYDRLAHYGQPELWDSDGVVRKIKAEEKGPQNDHQ